MVSWKTNANNLSKDANFKKKQKINLDDKFFSKQEEHNPKYQIQIKL